MFSSKEQTALTIGALCLLGLAALAPIVAALDYPIPYPPHHAWDEQDDPYNPLRNFGVYYMTDEGIDMKIEAISHDDYGFDVQIFKLNPEKVVAEQHISPTGQIPEVYDIHVDYDPVDSSGELYEIRIKNGDTCDGFKVFPESEQIPEFPSGILAPMGIIGLLSYLFSQRRKNGPLGL